MDDTLRVLVALQQCDSRIQEIQTQKAKGPQRIEILERHVIEQDALLTRSRELLETRKRERRESERRIEEIEAKVQRSNQKLGSIKSNKEYTAALKEIEDLESAKRTVEDQVIEIMEAVEELNSACRETEAAKASATAEFEAARDEVLRELEGLDGELGNLLQSRARLIQAADGNILKSYDALRKTRGGIAISPVVKGICQTCHLRIPPQQFNELIRGERMMNCPHCRRIIYWEDVKDKEAKAGISK